MLLHSFTAMNRNLELPISLGLEKLSSLVESIERKKAFKALFISKLQRKRDPKILHLVCSVFSKSELVDKSAFFTRFCKAANEWRSKELKSRVLKSVVDKIQMKQAMRSIYLMSLEVFSQKVFELEAEVVQAKFELTSEIEVRKRAEASQSDLRLITSHRDELHSRLEETTDLLQSTGEELYRVLSIVERLTKSQKQLLTEKETASEEARGYSEQLKKTEVTLRQAQELIDTKIAKNSLIEKQWQEERKALHLELSKLKQELEAARGESAGSKQVVKELENIRSEAKKREEAEAERTRLANKKLDGLFEESEGLRNESLRLRAELQATVAEAEEMRQTIHALNREKMNFFKEMTLMNDRLTRLQEENLALKTPVEPPRLSQIKRIETTASLRPEAAGPSSDEDADREDEDDHDPDDDEDLPDDTSTLFRKITQIKQKYQNL